MAISMIRMEWRVVLGLYEAKQTSSSFILSSFVRYDG